MATAMSGWPSTCRMKRRWGRSTTGRDSNRERASAAGHRARWCLPWYSSPLPMGGSAMTMTPQETAQYLYELEQIKQTKARYFRCLDTKQWADWRTCFTDDLHFYLGQDPKPVAASADEFVAYVSKLLADTVT